MASVVAACAPVRVESDDRDAGGGAVCVEDARAPTNCPVSWELVDSCTLVPATASIEAAVFAGGCPASHELASGATDTALVRRVAAVDETFEPIDHLARQRHGFAFVLRDASCNVIAWGCTEANLATAREIRTAVGTWEGENSCVAAGVGQCPSGESCVDGRCRPGSGCSLALVASGALPSASEPDARFGGPSIVATPDAFLLGYREHRLGSAGLHLLRIADDGSAAVKSTSVAACGMPYAGGIGVAFADSTGLVVSNLPDCSDGYGAGAAFFSCDGQGEFGLGSSPHDTAFSALATTSRCVARAATQGHYLFAYTAKQGSSTTAELAIVDGSGYQSTTPVQSLFGGQTCDFVAVASSPALVAVLGALPFEDALRLQVFANALGSPLVVERSFPYAAWASLTAWDQRVAVVHANGPHASLRIVQSDGLVSSLEYFASVPTLGADVTTLRDHVLTVTAMEGAFSVGRQAGATGLLGSGESELVVFSGDLGNVSLTDYAGHNVSVAAARQRVAVAWLNELAAPGTSPGGFALLECAE